MQRQIQPSHSLPKFRPSRLGRNFFPLFLPGKTFSSKLTRNPENLCKFAAQTKKSAESMEATKTREQAILWLKAAQKRQQDWQQEVKKRWAEKHLNPVTTISA